MPPRLSNLSSPRSMLSDLAITECDGPLEPPDRTRRIANGSRGLWCLLLLAALLAGPRFCVAAPPVTFNFTLANAQRTSAGVFKADGTLMRTIWSGVSYPAGANTASWDGTDDFGNLVADGAYVIRVLSNSCTYTWEGVVGNTSSSWTGSTVWKSYQPIGGLAIAGTKAYFGNGYPEACSTSGTFSTTDPQGTRKLLFFRNGANVWLVATDGTYVYWTGRDRGKAAVNRFVFAARVSDDSEVIFPNGTPYTIAGSGITYQSVIDKRTDGGHMGLEGSHATGMAVQRTGPFLFVAHGSKNEIDVVNKTTGALVRTITNITAPGALAVDGGNNLWLVRKNGAASEVGQYAVAADGTLAPLRSAAGTFDTPMALGVSPDSATLIVADEGSSQQLKAFAVGTGAASWTFGQAGGYAASPTVSDDRFMFDGNTFVAFQPDGSFWIGDYGNGRIQHYTAAREFIERVQYRTSSHNCSIDENNPTRLFSDYLEYAIDYSRPLGPNNGSWTQVRNWEKVLPAGYGDFNYRKLLPCTLSNGRTYALIPQNSPGGKMARFGLFEMTAAGQFRNTGVLTTTAFASLQPDGSIRTVNQPMVDETITWTKGLCIFYFREFLGVME